MLSSSLSSTYEYPTGSSVDLLIYSHIKLKLDSDRWGLLLIPSTGITYLNMHTLLTCLISLVRRESVHPALRELAEIAVAPLYSGATETGTAVARKSRIEAW